MSFLRVVSLNVWALPGFMSKHVVERMTAIMDRVLEVDADVVALQEVWTPRARNALANGGRGIGLQPAWPDSSSPGGLFVLTRLPVRRTAFTRFRLAGLPQRVHQADYYGRKGFVEVTLETDEGPAVLVNTHLQARYCGPGQYDEYLGVRAAQLAQLATCCHNHDIPSIAVGDFNFREGDPDYNGFIGLTGYADAAAELGQRQPTCVVGNPYSGSGHRGKERIDYVLVGGGASAVSVRRDFDTPLEFNGEVGAHSDHAGLVADIDLGQNESTRSRRDGASISLLSELVRHGSIEALQRRRSQRSRGAVLLAGLVLARPWIGRTIKSIGLASAAALFALSELFGADELAGFEETQRMLDDLAASGAS